MSKKILYKIYLVENHRAGTLIIDNIKEQNRVINNQEANFLLIGLINTLRIENLIVNLAYKKIYQLINKANKAKHYYYKAEHQHSLLIKKNKNTKKFLVIFL